MIKRLSIVLLLALVLETRAADILKTPTTFATGSSLTIQSGVTATFSPGSTVVFTGATIIGLEVASNAALDEHIANTSNPHQVTKTQVGLPLVPNVDATQRSNHTGTQSADSITDGTTNKAYTAPEKTKLAGVASGATANASDATLLERANHTGTQSADTITDGTTNKAYTAIEKTKLAGIASGATANSADATLLARANHTGTQAIATIVGLQAALDSYDTRLDAIEEDTVDVTYPGSDFVLIGTATDWAAALLSTFIRTSGTQSIAAGLTTTSQVLITPTIASFVNATHDHASAAGGGTLTEAALALADNTTNNASTARHGFAPKLPNNSSVFYNGVGGWTAPPGGGDVTGPAGGVVDGDMAVFADTTGKTLRKATSAEVLNIALPSSGTAVMTINSSGVTGTAAITTFGQTLLALADAAALRSAAGLGTAATANTGTASGEIPLLGTGGRLPIARIASGTPDGTQCVGDAGALVPCGSSGSSLTVQEVDGSPSGTASTIRFSNGTVTNNGGGQFTVTNSGGTGSITEASGSPLTADGSVGTYTFNVSGGQSIRITVTGRSTNASTPGVNLRFNADTGNNYERIESIISGTSTTINNVATVPFDCLRIGHLNAANSAADYSTAITATIPNYANTTFFKAFMGHAAGLNAANWEIRHNGGNWKSTAAITSLTIFLSGGNFASGTVIRVFTE